MTTAPNAAAASLAGSSTHQCTTAPAVGAGGFSAPAIAQAPALPAPTTAPSIGASLVGGGSIATPQAPIAGAPTGATAPANTAMITTLAQLAASVAASLGASTIGGASPIAGAAAAPTAGAAAPAAGPNTSGIIGFDPSIPMAGVMPTGVALPGPVPGATSIVANPNLTGPASGAQPAAPGATPVGAAAAPVAASAPLTTVAPGGNPQDAALVERALGVLRQSPSGAQAVDRMLAVGAKINVISDQEFAAMGHDSAHAFYDPKIDTMFLRRSDLADEQNVKFAAIALVHEGTHLLDDVSGISAPITQEITNRVVAAGGLGTPAGIEAREQGLFELTMIKETRAFLFAGTVARELGVQLPATDPTTIAINGGNDQGTYDAVWQRLLRSSYNEQGRSAAPRNL